MAAVCVALAACGSGTGGPSESADPDPTECTLLGQVNPLALSAVSRPAVQIEVRFLTLTDDFIQSIGLDFPDVHAPQPVATPGFGGKFEDRTTYATPDGTIAGVGGADVVVPNGHRPGSYLPNAYVGAAPGLDDGASFVQAPGDDDQCVDVADLLRFVVTGTDNVPATTAIVPNGDLGPGIGLATTILGANEVQALLQAIASTTGNSVIQAPTLRMYDGQRGLSIAQTGETSANELLDIVTSEVYGGVTLEAVRSGVTLDVRARIVQPTNRVELDIRPLSHGVVATIAGTHFVGGNPVVIQAPILVPTTVETMVSVPDGSTILLGGLKNAADDGQLGVPLLSRIPYVNRLFKNTSTLATSESLMLMVTPRIIIQEE